LARSNQAGTHAVR